MNDSTDSALTEGGIALPPAPPPPPAGPRMLESDSSGSRRMPWDEEAESSILGGILLKNDALDDVQAVIHPMDFFREGHRRIYGAMLALANRKHEIDTVTLGDELRKRGDLESAGGPAYISALDAFVPSTANLARYARIVRDHAERRAAITAMQGALAKLYEAEAEPADVVGDVQAKLDEAVSQHNTTDLVNLKPTWVEVLKEMEAAHERGDRVIGAPSGFSDLDYMTAGFEDGDFVIIGGTSGTGKTTFMTAVARNIAKATGRPCPIFSLEMKQRSVQKRMLAQAANVDGMRVRTAQLTGADWPKLANAINSLARLDILMDDGGDQTVQEIRAKYRRAKNRYGRLGGVFIDYLQLMKAPQSESRSRTREQEVAAITRGLRALSKEMDCPLFALAQLNDNPENREGHRPRPEDVRESRTIRHDADIILLLHRPSKFSEKQEDKGILEVIIGKQRNGPEGIVRLSLDPESMAIRDLAKDRGAPWG